MEQLYPVALIIHLLCAIIFIGYLFFDVVIFSRAKKLLDEKTAEDISCKIGQKAIKIMPFCLLLLVITGGFMVTRWINSDAGFFDTNLQKILMLKLLFVSIILIAVIYSLSCKFIFKCPNRLKSIHPIALILGILIVICAKSMFYL